MLQRIMACREAQLIETLAYIDAHGQHVRIPRGPCTIEADARSDITTLRWGDSDQEAVPLQPDLLDGLVSAGIVEFDEPMLRPASLTSGPLQRQARRGR